MICTECTRRDNKIALYGAGACGRLIYEIFKICAIKVDCFIDNDNNKTTYEDIPVLSPNDIDDKDDYKVYNCVSWYYSKNVHENILSDGFIHVYYYQEVIDDILLHNYDLLEEMLEKFEDSPEMEVMYSLNDIRDDCEKEDVLFNDDKIAVYTCIFGDYDTYYIPKFLSKKIDYYYVSDKELVHDPNIQWINSNSCIPKSIASNIKRNRYAKMHPHELFPQYRYSIYIDGNIEVVGDISNCFKQSKTGISLYKHYCRDCLFYEGLQIVNYKRVSKEDVFNHLQNYIKEGMPLHYGLPEMAIIAREHNLPLCVELMNSWWDEFEHGAQRDQLSFMYCMWKLGLGMNDLAILGTDFRKSQYIQYHKHINDSKNIKNMK